MLCHSLSPLPHTKPATTQQHHHHHHYHLQLTSHNSHMLLSHPILMPPQLGLTSPTSTHNPQLFTHHKTTQLGTFRPSNQEPKYLSVDSLKPLNFNGLGFCNTHLSSPYKIIQFGSSTPRSKKHNFLSLNSPETVIFKGCKLGNMKLGFYNSQCFRPRSQNQSFLCFDPLNKQEFSCRGLGELKLGFNGASQRKGSSIVRSKSVLSVDKVLESDGNVGVDRSSYDAIVIGSLIGGLVAATQLAVKGARVLVLEKYVIPGGSSRFYKGDGYAFDVGSSVMFGFSDKVIIDHRSSVSHRKAIAVCLSFNRKAIAALSLSSQGHRSSSSRSSVSLFARSSSKQLVSLASFGSGSIETLGSFHRWSLVHSET